MLWKSRAVKNIEEHLQAPPKSLLLAQTEDYIEYSRSDKEMEIPKARNRLEEPINLLLWKNESIPASRTEWSYFIDLQIEPTG
ncbi:pre-mRNA-splicing factor Slu7-like isoform 2-T3 [Glossina fuscipes fuscipes]